MASFSLLISFGIFAIASSTFAPMPAMQPFSAMNFQAMQQNMNMQAQKQGQGSSAATGDATADFGQLQSQQNSNSNTGANGTTSQAGSLGACAGGNCALNGAAQLNAGFQSQGQSQKAGQNAFASVGTLGAGGFPNLSNLLGGNNLQQQQQRQSQNQIGGASVGTGQAALGNVTSVQNTQGETNEMGGKVGSTSAGQGIGQQVGLSGAVQAKGSDQTAQQVLTQGANSRNASGAVQRPGCVAPGAHNSAANLTNAQQLQTQSQGEGAAVGQGTANEGAVQSAQNSNVETNSSGTRVSSGSTGQAAGKGLRLSGAASSSGQSAGQLQSASNINANQASVVGPC